MANNQSFPSERFLSGAPSNPAVPVSGQACRFGNRVGVALANQDSSGNQAFDFGGVYLLPVKGADDGGNIAVVAGDALFWTDADGVTNLSKKVSGYYAGVAMSAVAAGSTATIGVALGVKIDGYAGTAAPQLRLYQATYNFAVSGGASGATINFGPGLPANALVWDGVLDIVTAITGPGASVAFSTGEAANDLKTATAVASLGAGRLALVPVGTAASSVKTTAARQPNLVISGAALTAGKANLILQYFQSS